MEKEKFNSVSLKKGNCSICQKETWVSLTNKPSTWECQDCLEKKLKDKYDIDPKITRLKVSNLEQWDKVKELLSLGKETFERLIVCSGCREIMNNEKFPSMVSPEVIKSAEKKGIKLSFYKCSCRSIVHGESDKKVEDISCVSCNSPMEKIEPIILELGKAQEILKKNRKIIESYSKQGSVASFVLGQWKCNCADKFITTAQF